MKCESCKDSAECPALMDINLATEGFRHQLKEAGIEADAEVRVRECDMDKYHEWKVSTDCRDVVDELKMCEDCKYGGDDSDCCDRWYDMNPKDEGDLPLMNIKNCWERKC